MILISKEEAKVIRKKYPHVSITRTMKQHSNRGRYYMTEDAKAMKEIEKMRKEGVVLE